MLYCLVPPVPNAKATAMIIAPRSTAIGVRYLSTNGLSFDVVIRMIRNEYYLAMRYRIPCP